MCKDGRTRGGVAAVLVALAALGGLASGCVTVSPAQREQLSKPEMNPAADVQEDVWHGHIEAARHGAMGGHGGAGGGCGCG
ncbi:MAG: DUF4266 domain-containing protein [Nannocystaceae bacterium]